MKKDLKYKILIVDDNENNLFSLRNLIEEYIEAEVVQANCGQKALQELFRNKVDLIILDIQMEEMDGFELASLIKQRKKTRDIPIVFLTASYLGDEFKSRGFQVGAVDYLTKPIDEYQLINRINIYLKLIEKERNMNIILEERVKKQTKALQDAIERIKEANRAKDVFLANISHELRTPLNIILGTIQMFNVYLKDNLEVDRGQVRKKIDMQVQNCYRLLRLVNNLIDISKIDTGKLQISMSRCDIIQIVEAITLSVAEYVEDKGIHLVFDTDIEERIIKCDLDAIERIVLNLLSNAIKFTPPGGTIYVGMENLEDHVHISVRDTGVGIPEDKIDIIFERFKQADELLTRRHEGSGIGLSLVKSLVELHGGRIHVDSQYQKGSEFIVTLPANLSLKENAEENVYEYSSEESVVQKIHVEFSDIYFQETV